jgi:hypothetical protein
MEKIQTLKRKCSKKDLNQEQYDAMKQNWNGYLANEILAPQLGLRVERLATLRQSLFGNMTEEAKARLRALKSSLKKPVVKKVNIHDVRNSFWTQEKDRVVKEFMKGLISQEEASDIIKCSQYVIKKRALTIERNKNITRLKKLEKIVKPSKLTPKDNMRLQLWLRGRIDWPNLLKRAKAPASHLIIHANKGNYLMGNAAFDLHMEYKKCVREGKPFYSSCQTYDGNIFSGVGNFYEDL